MPVLTTSWPQPLRSCHVAGVGFDQLDAAHHIRATQNAPPAVLAVFQRGIGRYQLRGVLWVGNAPQPISLVHAGVVGCLGQGQRLDILIFALAWQPGAGAVRPPPGEPPFAESNVRRTSVVTTCVTLGQAAAGRTGNQQGSGPGTQRRCDRGAASPGGAAGCGSCLLGLQGKNGLACRCATATCPTAKPWKTKITHRDGSADVVHEDFFPEEG